MFNKKFYVSSIFPLIKSKIKNIEVIKKKQQYENYTLFLKEMATIHIDFGRQSGHTTLAYKILDEYKNSIILVPNLSIKSKMDQKYKDRIFSYSQYEEGRCRGRNYDVIVIDISCMASKSLIKSVYNEWVKFVILLG